MMQKRLDDADAAAGTEKEAVVECSNNNNIQQQKNNQHQYDPEPCVETTTWLKESSSSNISMNGINSSNNLGHIIVLGFDISNYSQSSQFLLCAGGVFLFSLLYGYLQELIAVHLCDRQLGLFLAVSQFSGYTFWSYLLRNHVERRKTTSGNNHNRTGKIPLEMYIGVSLLRALDLSMTNLAMQFINYPAKTLMKSSRVCWIMLFGVLIARKRYTIKDYATVVMMALGLCIFMHADARTSAVFQPLGVVMLVVSLMCDGVLTNLSEALMNKYHVGQDEYIFSLYSIALVFITIGAAVKGELFQGLLFLCSPGTYNEYHAGLTPTWSVTGKIFVLGSFSTLGFFASSCSAAITKHFGALTMSITSTARKATTLFISFALFPNNCSFEHVSGIAIFIMALLAKSFKKSSAAGKNKSLSDKVNNGDYNTGSSLGVATNEDILPHHIRRIDSGYSIV